MYPVTIFIRGLENEPIDVIKAGATKFDGHKMYFVLTPPDTLFPKGRLLSVHEEDILIYADNNPSDTALHGLDKMIEEGDRQLSQKKESYNGLEVQ